MNKRLEITPLRRLVLIVGLPFVLLGIGAVAISGIAYAGQATYQVRLSIPARGRPVSVSVQAGDLRVGPASGDRLSLRGTALYALSRSTVRWQASSAGLTVTSRCNFVNWLCWFDYHVAVPAGVPETFSDGSGNITVTGLTSPSVTASDSSGNIKLTFTKVPELVKIDDAFGNVTVVLPPGKTTYKVSAQASFGAASIKVPTSPSSPHVIAVVNQSGSVLISE